MIDRAKNSNNSVGRLSKTPAPTTAATTSPVFRTSTNTKAGTSNAGASVGSSVVSPGDKNPFGSVKLKKTALTSGTTDASPFLKSSASPSPTSPSSPSSCTPSSKFSKTRISTTASPFEAKKNVAGTPPLRVTPPSKFGSKTTPTTTTPMTTTTPLKKPMATPTSAPLTAPKTASFSKPSPTYGSAKSPLGSKNSSPAPVTARSKFHASPVTVSTSAVSPPTAAGKKKFGKQQPELALKSTSTTPTISTTKSFSTTPLSKAITPNARLATPPSSANRSRSSSPFNGVASAPPGAKAESYSTDRLAKTGNKSRLDETAIDGKSVVDDYAKLWIQGILSKTATTSTSLEKQASEYAQRIRDAGGLPVLRRLSVRDNDLVTTFTRAISNDPSVTSIKIQSDERFKYLCPSLIVHFAEGLRTNVNLETLIITGVELGNDFLSELATSITTNFNLKYIDLSNNSFTNDALVDFCIGMGENQSLQTVLLHKQQSPIFSHREDLAIEALDKNQYIRTYQIEFQSTKIAADLDQILARNKKQNKSMSDYGSKLLSFLEKEAILAEKRFAQRKQEVIAQEVQESDMPFLYELAQLAQQYKLPYETTVPGTDPTTNTSFASSQASNNNATNSNSPSSIAKINTNLLTADGAFLTDEFIGQYIIANKDDGSVTFEYTNECKVFKRFSISDPARSLIVTKFVDALVDHPRASTITHLNMSNTLIGNDFCIALRNRCYNDGSLLPKLHLINFETNLITGPGVSALAECIASPTTWRYLQALKLDNQRHLISSDAEADLANALCVNRSIIKVSLRIRTLFERRKVSNFVLRNVDFLRQARRWHGMKTGTIKERERNKIEKLFDSIAANDSSITEVNLVSDQVFVSLSPEEVVKAAMSFANNCYVTRVKMSGLRLDDNFGVAMGNALLTNTSIEKLDLESNSICSEGLLAIIAALRENNTVSELLVRHQSKPMSSADEEKIPGLVSENKTIVKFSIDLRSIGVRDSVDKLCRLNQERKRKSSPKRQDSNDGSVESIKRNRCQLLFDKIAANDPTVIAVELVSDQVFIGLNEGDVERAALSFATNTHVTKVKMSGLKLSDAFGVALANSLAKNGTIVTLDLERNSIGTDGMTAILSTLSTNRSITEMFLRHQSKPLSSADEEKVPAFLEPNSTITKLSVDIRSVGARAAIDKKIRYNQELKRKNSTK